MPTQNKVLTKILSLSRTLQIFFNLICICLSTWKAIVKTFGCVFRLANRWFAEAGAKTSLAYFIGLFFIGFKNRPIWGLQYVQKKFKNHMCTTSGPSRSLTGRAMCHRPQASSNNYSLVTPCNICTLKKFETIFI